MTIDESIEHAEERACGNDQCAKDHAQLADWLRELRRTRMEIDLLKTLRDGFKEDAQKYKAENAKLRELVRGMWDSEYDCKPTDCELCDTQCLWKEFGIHMRELGIEVS